MSHSNKTIHEFGSVQSFGSQIEIKFGTALGALSLSSKITAVKTTGAATATLAAGKQGQEKIISMHTDGGDCVITTTLAAGNTTITMGDAGDSIHLVYIGTAWHVVANTGCALA